MDLETWTAMPISLVNRRAAVMMLVLASLALGMPSLAAQSITVGGLTIAVVDDHGAPVQEASVTLERGGVKVRSLTAGRNGMVIITVLNPGRYSVLAEQFGYQPVRMRDVDVVGGAVTRITIRAVRRPPPITSVDEQASNAVISGASRGRTINGRELTSFDQRTDMGGALGALSEADWPRDGRYGAVSSGNGLLSRYTSLYVDGIPESMLRHPGLPSEPVAPILFARDAMSQLAYSGMGSNVTGPGTVGSTIGAESVQGGERFSFRPWATFSSAKLGGNKLDNPGDSSGTSIRAGVAMSGSIKADTASWFLRADYQRLQQPAASPFDAARATSDTAADLSGAIATAAQALGGKNVASWLAPTVRDWKGGTAAGRLDWRFGSSTLLGVRVAGASWTETNPLAGIELVNGAGSELKSTDISAAASLTTGSTEWTSESRIGVRTAKRDWTGAALPYTGIVGDAVAFGSAVTLPGNFKEAGFSISEAFTYRTGSHAVQGAIAFDNRATTYDWLPGSAGVFQFGDLAGFAAGRGSFYQAIRGNAAPSLTLSDLSLSVQDDWRVTPQMQLILGVRMDREALPEGVIAANAGWERVAGLFNNVGPRDAAKKGLGARGGFAWDVSGTGQTVVRGAAAVVPGQFDVVSLAEAVQYDGDVTIRRATGTLAWPQVGATAGSAAGQALTMFGDSIRKPRSFKSELSITQRVANGTTLTIGGAYRHADYQLQRSDLNLVGAPLATGADGRPIYGTLEQYGALLTPKVGTNRRFGEFDKVYLLTASGYNDYYEATVSLEHRMSRGLDLMIGYTYSKTTDNLPGLLSGDPADQVSPFPSGLSGARWEDGRSDLDIPHRISATATYTSNGKSPFTVAARFRHRSGLPFTPGFRNGVDANGDGSGANDPAFVTAAVAALSNGACLGGQSGKFAARNSCRDKGVSSLDLRVAVPITNGWAVTLDGFNLVGTTTGLFDHAAVLVDPRGTITTDATGHTILPLIANPGFGQLLSRRGDPRTIRIGFRVEN